MNENVIFILPAAIALFWILRIFLQKEVDKARLFIIFGMLMALLTMFYRETFALFTFPFFHLAVREKTSAHGIGKWDSLVFLPSVLLIPYAGETLANVFLIIQIAVISIWSVLSVRKYNRQLAEVYDSSVEENTANDIGQILMFMIFTVITTVIIVMLPDFVTSSLLVRIILAIFLSVLQFNVGMLTFRMKDTPGLAAEIAEIAAEEALRNDGNMISPASGDEKLLAKVESENLYLDPTLSLVSLAEMLHTNRTYLSSMIHSLRGVNFSDYINNLRINYFIDIVRNEGPSVNIKDAAMRAGYSNIQSFYRNFSDKMQMTPKTWVANYTKQL